MVSKYANSDETGVLIHFTGLKTDDHRIEGAFTCDMAGMNLQS